MSLFYAKPEKAKMPTEKTALKGRNVPIETAAEHFVSGMPLAPPYPSNMQQCVFGLGCFWGAERKFWQLPGVYVTAVGYSAGFTPNPTYEEVCSGSTGHNEVVLVVYNPSQVSFKKLLAVFWESHNPTQGMRQGNDLGTQYRSGVYVYSDEQAELAEHSKQVVQAMLTEKGYGEITTEIIKAKEFYFAEAYHQQYLAKNPNGYCGLGGTGIVVPYE